MGSSNDTFTCSMAQKMREKFFKYWGDWRNINPIIYIATVLDPRYKMKWVTFTINRVYEASEAKELADYIENTLMRMFKYYDAITASDNVGSSSKKMGSDKGLSSTDDYDKILDEEFESFESSDQQGNPKSELERYLTEACEKRQQESFDILFWWKTTGSKYMTLSCMAKDLLAIPVSTVASECAFSTGGRVIDPFRSSLTLKLVQALICSQDWIRGDNMYISNEEDLEDLEKIEAALDSDILEDED